MMVHNRSNLLFSSCLVKLALLVVVVVVVVVFAGVVTILTLLQTQWSCKKRSSKRFIFA